MVREVADLTGLSVQVTAALAGSPRHRRRRSPGGTAATGKRRQQHHRRPHHCATPSTGVVASGLPAHHQHCWGTEDFGSLGLRGRHPRIRHRMPQSGGQILLRLRRRSPGRQGRRTTQRQRPMDAGDRFGRRGPRGCLGRRSHRPGQPAVRGRQEPGCCCARNAPTPVPS